MPGTRLTTADAVRSIINLLDSAAESGPSSSAAVLVRIDRIPTTPDEELVFSVRRLPAGLHPMAVLDGFVAPPAWAGIGVIAVGRVHKMDEPDVDRGRGRVILVLTRDGTLGSALRVIGGPVHVDVRPVATVNGVFGELPLALCRSLGVPFATAGGPGEPEGDPK